MWSESLNICDPTQDIINLIDELNDILHSMDLPEWRINNLSANNLRWLQRNILVKNSSHSKIKRAVELIKWMLVHVNK